MPVYTTVFPACIADLLNEVLTTVFLHLLRCWQVQPPQFIPLLGFLQQLNINVRCGSYFFDALSFCINIHGYSPSYKSRFSVE